MFGPEYAFGEVLRCYYTDENNNEKDILIIKAAWAAGICSGFPPAECGDGPWWCGGGIV